MIIAALKFDWTIDVTGLATIFLAIVTLATVIVGGIALVQGRAELRVSRDEVEASQRPVLIPARVDYEAAQGPRRGDPSNGPWVSLRLLNIGAGPALNVSIRLQILALDGSVIGRSPRWWVATHPGIGTDPAAGDAVIDVLVDDLAQLPSFWLELHYEDVAGKGWLSKGRHVVDPKPGEQPGFQSISHSAS